MSSAIQGRVALITGGAKGIGFNYAKHLILNGIKAIVLADIDVEAGNDAKNKLEEFGEADILFVKANVGGLESIESAFKATISEFKHLDVFINNVGILNEYSWRRVIKINFISMMEATYLAMKKYLPKYKSVGEGIIVHTGCALSFDPFQSMPVYSSTKLGMIGLHRALSNEYYYNLYKCRFLAICPGLTNTSMLKDLHLKHIDLELFDEECCGISKQKVDQCGFCLIEALNHGKNGSVWICEANRTYQLSISDVFKSTKDEKV